MYMFYNNIITYSFILFIYKCMGKSIQINKNLKFLNKLEIYFKKIYHIV